MSKPKTFHLDTASLELPRGAHAGGTRHILSFGGQPVAAFTQGKFRPYIHPVWTPEGIIVTAEGPVDHPHHSGIWCAADHVAGLHDGPEGIERYDYCFYVNDVFQGRAPGSIRMIGMELQAASHVQATIRQEMQWLSPREWGAPEGRIVLLETRTTTIGCVDQAYVIDIASELRAGDGPVEIGPTRHAYFNARVCDTLALSNDCLPIDNHGRKGAAAIGRLDIGWVDFCGNAGKGTIAGLATIPPPNTVRDRFVADWGVASVGPFRHDRAYVAADATLRLRCRFIAHDGPLQEAWISSHTSHLNTT